MPPERPEIADFEYKNGRGDGTLFESLGPESGVLALVRAFEAELVDGLHRPARIVP